MPRKPRGIALDAVERTLYAQLLEALCEEMGLVLQQSAYSPNIKERRDFSTAIFDAGGGMAAQGRNIPVHLGSMPLSVRAVLDALSLQDGDVALLNDPYHGGTHLPDLTVATPYYSSRPGHAAARSARLPLCYLANRAHHADVGGMSPGSLPISSEIYQEGLVIPPVKLVRAGEVDEGILALVCANSRTPEERRGDLMAQLAALRRGKERLDELTGSSPSGSNRGNKQGKQLPWAGIFAALQDYSATAVEDLFASLPSGKAVAKDAVELAGGARAEIKVSIAVRGRRMVVDFSGTAPQCDGPYNAVRAITLSAVFYVMRCLLPAGVPTNDGLMRPLEVVTRAGSLVDASHPAAVAGGNVETSQRIVDVLLAAFAKLMPGRMPAASQGTMNNVTLGGIDPSTGQPFAYYETIGGGHGGHPDGNGLCGRHAHMTNSLNTPIETLEHSYPLRVRRYSLRRGSGGGGLHQGGDGLVRELEFLAPGELTLLTQRRISGPPGLSGGRPGKPGRNILLRNGRRKNLPGTASVRVQPGDRLVIKTPGGGGWGNKR